LTPTSLNFITKNETVFVAELNLTQIDWIRFFVQGQMLLLTKEPPTKFKRSTEPPNK
jgi:hypothetical protein